MYTGLLVEQLHCEGLLEGRVLSAQERAEIVEFALHFEECNQPKAALEAMSDKDLVQASYWFMAEYAKGQV